MIETKNFKIKALLLQEKYKGKFSDDLKLKLSNSMKYYKKVHRLEQKQA